MLIILALLEEYPMGVMGCWETSVNGPLKEAKEAATKLWTVTLVNTQTGLVPQPLFQAVKLEPELGAAVSVMVMGELDVIVQLVVPATPFVMMQLTPPTLPTTEPLPFPPPSTVMLL